MNKILLTISSLLIFVSVVVKLYFISIEPIYISNILGKTDIVAIVVSSIFLLGYSLKSIKDDTKSKYKYNVKIFFLFILTIIVLSISTIYNLNKKSLDWDAIALYDARAKFLTSGMSFSQMGMLSEFDDKNKYYYLLYPPFTSIIHQFWYKFNVNLPIGVLYSIFLILMVLILGSLVIDYLGLFWTVLTVLLVVSNKDIFSISIIEYTNLPFTLYLTSGIFLLLNGFVKNKRYIQILGFLFIAGSIWIRFLEPVWLAVVLAYIVATLFNKKIKQNMLCIIIGISIILSQYIGWNYFQKIVANTPQIFHINKFVIFESIWGLFTGSFLNILFFYLKSYGVLSIIYFTALIKINKKEPNEFIFLRLIIIICLVMYFAGIYGISFMFDWWREMSGSLARSSSYLIPISIFLIISNIKYLLEKNIGSAKTIKYE